MTMADDAASSINSDDLPVVRSISASDLKDVLAKGFDDFWAMPTHVIFIGLIYSVAGLILGRLAFGYEVLPILYPLAAGFALLGPIAAIGLYELSRRRELGMKTSWTDAFKVIDSPSRGAIMGVGFILLAIFVVWITIADMLFTQSFGDRKPESLGAMVEEIVMTPGGQWVLIAGNAIGFVFAAVALVLSAVSFPLLLDRKVSASVAMQTSFRVFMKNPVTIALWGLIVAFFLLLGSLPLFAGLAIVVPVLGHATWHLYRRTVEPVSGPIA